MRRLTCFAVLLVAAVPLFATEPNLSPKQRELLEKLFTQINLKGQTTKMVDALFEQLQSQLVQQAQAEGNDPADIAEGEEIFKSFRAKVAAVDIDGALHDAYLRIYAKYFTEHEIMELTAFYASPTGKKTLHVMDDLMREGMQAGAEFLQPKIEEIVPQVLAEHEKKRRPWLRTMADMRTIATALEAYAVDNEKYPTGDYTSLKTVLEPTYIRKLPEKDMWDHAYAYVVSDDKQHYRIVSAGADSTFEGDSRRIVAVKEGETTETRYRDRLEEDLIYADGAFVQLPVQAKPKE